MHDVDILRLILSKGLARNGRENARNGRKKGAKRARKKRVYHLTLLFWPSWLCRVFLKTLFSYGPNRRHGPKRRRRHVVLSLWGACCFSLSLASSSIAPFSSWNGFISVLLGLPVRMFLDFAACSVHLDICYVFVCCDCGVFVLNVECWRPAWGFFVWKKMPDCWCGVVKIAL